MVECWASAQGRNTQIKGFSIPRLGHLILRLVRELGWRWRRSARVRRLSSDRCRNTFQIMCHRCKLLKIKIQPQYIRFEGTHIWYGCGQLRAEIVNPLKKHLLWTNYKETGTHNELIRSLRDAESGRKSKVSKITYVFNAIINNSE